MDHSVELFGYTEHAFSLTFCIVLYWQVFCLWPRCVGLATRWAKANTASRA